MKKYKVTVELTKEYEIDIDENKFTEEDIKNFESYMYKLDEEDDKYKSLANDYCRLRAIGFDGFIEGYGYVLENGKVPFGVKDKDVEKGINFKVIDDGESYPNINVEEI